MCLMVLRRKKNIFDILLVCLFVGYALLLVWAMVILTLGCHIEYNMQYLPAYHITIL